MIICGLSFNNRSRASDRKYWDGWGSKAMFMRPDGNFTRKDVIANEGDTICVVVLVSLNRHVMKNMVGD